MEGRTVPCCKKLFGAPQKGAVKKLFSAPGVVPKHETQKQTTAFRKDMWSQGKKYENRPQRSGKACGPRQEMRKQTTAFRKDMWSQSKKCEA